MLMMSREKCVMSVLKCVCVVWGERGNTGVNMLLLQCDLLGGHESLFLFF